MFEQRAANRRRDELPGMVAACEVEVVDVLSKVIYVGQSNKSKLVRV